MAFKQKDFESQLKKIYQDFIARHGIAPWRLGDPRKKPQKGEKKLRVSLDPRKILPIDSEGRLEVPCTVEAGGHRRQYVLEARGIILRAGQSSPAAGPGGTFELSFSDGRRLIIPSMTMLFRELESQLAALWAPAGLGTASGPEKAFGTPEQRSAKYAKWQSYVDDLHDRLRKDPKLTWRWIREYAAKHFDVSPSSIRDHVRNPKTQ